MPPQPNFIENSAAASRAGSYITVTVDVARVLESWRDSLFSYEWLRPDGTLKDESELPPGERPKCAAVADKIESGAALEQPVLGIGLLDNIEIGVGRATFLTLARLGAKKIPVHVPKTHADEFSDFAA